MQKIESGRLRGRRLLALPRGVAGLRPTSARVRGAIFDRLGDRVRGARVLDLFAGSGALAIEAISRGAAMATLVERHPRVVRHLRSQLEALELGGMAQVVAGDALVVAGGRASEGGYDLVLVDPPFATPEVVEPLAARLVDGWLRPDAIVVCELELVRGKSRGVAWPDPLVLEATKTYGQAELHFVRYEAPQPESQGP